MSLMSWTDADSGFDEDGSTCSSPYWEYLNSMVLRSRMDIEQERKLLIEINYQTTHNYNVSVGISVARGMVPSVRLTNTRLNLPIDQISLSLDTCDWYEFLEMITKITTNEHSNNNNIDTKMSMTESFTVCSAFLFD